MKLIGFVTLVTLSLTVNASYLNLVPNLFPRAPLPKSAMPSDIVLNTITQRLDNFDPLNPNEWQQRYYSRDDFYQPGGPIFVFLAGEWNITEYRMDYSLMADLAQELNGSIFYLEHRFYGESRPTK